MPYKTRWVAPAKFLTRKGVDVYHTYRHDNADDVMHSFHFTTNREYSETAGDLYGSFDVRELNTWPQYAHIPTDRAVRQAIIDAIDIGEIQPFNPYKP
jgi:hypothetical protein